MTHNRYAKRQDATQPAIVRGLRDLGYQVEIIGQPCDLLVRNPRTDKLDVLEVDGITKNRKRDQRQLDFLRDWQVPLVRTLDDALRALGTNML